jgi:hypothetical protein
MAAIHIPSHNLTFVHIPKNAGSSVVDWLRNNFETSLIKGHPNLNMIKTEWAVDKTFAIVRNPWARMVSAYFYLKQYGFYWEQNNIRTIEDFPSWDDFISKLDYNTASWNTIGTNQLDWIEGGVDWVLRTEHLLEDFKVIQTYLNCSIPLPYINTSNHDEYRNYYTEAQRDKIGQVFERDINTFNYSF